MLFHTLLQGPGKRSSANRIISKEVPNRSDKEFAGGLNFILPDSKRWCAIRY